MNLNQLRLFYYTAKYQSPTAAAHHLYVTQPAVTTGIQRLESHYNVRLFLREGKNLSLTEAGEALYELADKIFEIEALTEDCIRSFQEKNEHRLRIHSSETFGAYYLPSLINRFNESYPTVNITLDILLTDTVVKNTLNRKNDIGFISYPVENKSLWIKEILEDKLLIVVRPDHPCAIKTCLEPSDLNGQRIIRHEKSSAIQSAFARYIAANGISVSMSTEYSNNEAIKRAVEMGTGIALMSKEVVRKEIRRGELKAIALSDPTVSRKFYVIRHKIKYVSPTLQGFFDMTKKWASELTKSF